MNLAPPHIELAATLFAGLSAPQCLTEVVWFTELETWGIQQAALWAGNTVTDGFKVDTESSPTPHRIEDEKKRDC
jgi:hypothetical protein